MNKANIIKNNRKSQRSQLPPRLTPTRRARLIICPLPSFQQTKLNLMVAVIQPSILHNIHSTVKCLCTTVTQVLEASCLEVILTRTTLRPSHLNLEASCHHRISLYNSFRNKDRAAMPLTNQTEVTLTSFRMATRQWDRHLRQEPITTRTRMVS